MKKQLKVIFKEQEKKDGTTFMKMLTILKKKDGTNQWAQIKFGDGVNTKVWKNQHQIIEVEQKEMPDGSKNLRVPNDFKPYTYKGKLKYPYVYVQEILRSKPYDYKPSNESHYVDDADMSFSMDDVDDNLPWD